MTKNTYFILLSFLLCVYVLPCIAQRRIQVPEGYGTLNEAIRNDVNTDGNRTDVNTVYVLKRGGVYVLSGSIIASGFNLNIEAEEGSGPRPYVLMGFLTGATQVEESFNVFNNLSFKSIHLTNINEFNTYVARMFSVDGPNARLSFYDCLFDGSGQTMMRLNAGGAKIYMRNCTVSRMGRPSNPDNGRVIDDRGNEVDSIVVENNTWYNITSRIVRDGGATINYARMNQNTFVNVGQRLAAIGPVNRFIFTNNVIVNPRYIGNSPASDIVSLEFIPTGANSQMTIGYNNIFYEQSVRDVWTLITQETSEARIQPPLVTASNQALINSAPGMITELLTFTRGPVAPTEIIRLSQLGTGSTVPDWDWSNATAGEPWNLDIIAYHDFSYATTSQSYTASSTGEPLGDLRWFAGFEVAWNLSELVRDATMVIENFEQSEILSADMDALAALENEIQDAILVYQDALSTRAETAEAYQELLAALNAFKAGFIITNVPGEQRFEVNVFPNPTTDLIYIANRGNLADGVSLVDQSGKMVEHKRLRGEVEYVDLKDYSPGTYVLIFQKNEKRLSTKKIIKQ